MAVDKATVFYAALKTAAPGQGERLRAFIDSCMLLGATSAFNKFLLVRLAATEGDVTPLGFGPDGQVQVPWMIQGHKEASRDFARAVAGAVAGAVAHEARVMWTARRAHPMLRPALRIEEVLDAAEGVRDALAALARAVGAKR